MSLYFHFPTCSSGSIYLHPDNELTHIDDMPDAAREFFYRPARAGYEWICLNGKWPEEVAVSLPSTDELSKSERHWRNAEIGVTDRCFAPDWGPVGWSTDDRQAALNKLMTYRAHLKAGPNEHPAFPDQSWRPIWPDGVPRPVQ